MRLGRRSIGLALASLVAFAATAMETVAPVADDTFVPPADLAEGWYARIETSMGRILVHLLPDQSPQAVAHFVGMAEGSFEWFDAVQGKTVKAPYYDGLIVHRAVAGERFEAGDPLGSGSGAPPLYLAPEGQGPVNFNRPGRMGMTRALGGRISAVQFFITAAPTPHFNGFHPCFGEVLDGSETVFNLSKVTTYANGKPIDPPVIRAIRIFTVGNPPPLAEPRPYKPTQMPVRLKHREDPSVRRSP